MTDPEIAAIVFREVIGREGSPEERARAIGCYLKHLPGAVAESSGYRLMPGIEELLDRLIDGGTLLGLVTGNIEAAAHIKLARARLNRFFSFGGYGSDSPDRTEVTKAALGRGGLVSGGVLADGNCLAVGDTPRDVVAGHGADIEVVGVATGSYDVAQLRAAGADYALETVRSGFPL
ncbi:MAG: HAD family hydrolase, partial [Thermoleophilia bacterium]